MSTAWVECWKCDECGFRWIKTEIYPERCASSKCRKRSWDKNANTVLPVQPNAVAGFVPGSNRLLQLNAVIGAVPPPSPKIDIESLLDICEGKLPEKSKSPIFSTPENKQPMFSSGFQLCPYTEYVQESGETYTCGLMEGHKGKHARGARL